MAQAQVLLIGLAGKLERELKGGLAARGHRPLVAPPGRPALREAVRGAEAAVLSGPPELIAELRTAAPGLSLLALCAGPDAALAALRAGAEQTFPRTTAVAVLAALELSLRWRRPRPLREPDSHACGDLQVDLARRRVARGGRPLALTPAEFELLACLLAGAGRPVSRERILERLGAAGGFDADTRLVDVHVRNLRKKVELDPALPELVLSVPGIGYRLRPSSVERAVGAGCGSAA